MLSENDVIQAVCNFLKYHGYRVTSRTTTKQHGVDIVAHHEETGNQFFIEAKGQTSSKENTKRFGKPFNSAQVKVHVAEAFYQVTSLLRKDLIGSRRIAMAFPETSIHKRYLDRIRPAICHLGIEVLLVDTNQRVRTL